MNLIDSKCYYHSILSSDYYYDSIQINVVQSGNYTLSSVDSRIQGVIAYLYKEHFSEYTSYERLTAHSSDSCPMNEFKIITELQSSVTYILIMTPYLSIGGGHFSILVSGPNNITFNPISKSHIESIFSAFNIEIFIRTSSNIYIRTNKRNSSLSTNMWKRKLSL